MDVFLMFKDKKFDFSQDLPEYAQDLIIDLGLDIIFKSASNDDEFYYEVIKKSMLFHLTDKNEIYYRQDVLKDCINNVEIVKDIYALTLEAIKKEKESLFGFFMKYPDSIVYSARQVLEDFFEVLKKIKIIAVEKNSYFFSEGFKSFFERLKLELSDEYLQKVDDVLKKLKFENGILITSQLGVGAKPSNFRIMYPKQEKQNLLKSLIKKKSTYTITIPERDEGGYRALSEIKNKSFEKISNILANTVYYLLDFFNQLKIELAFYLSWAILYEKLQKIGVHLSYPVCYEVNERIFSFESLSDVSLVLAKENKVVENNLLANRKDLLIITGANMGGKTTFLRSIAQAAVFSQCGMFVGAKSFHYSLSSGIFTHFKKEEDKFLQSGKFDEELKRLSKLIDYVKPNALFLFNESFSSTNDNEASKIAKYIVENLIEKKIRIFFVTHLYEFAHLMDKENLDTVMFLKAQRTPDGQRTFKIIESKPMRKSYAEDLFSKIFLKEVSI